jgi:hypothetical protein
MSGQGRVEGGRERLPSVFRCFAQGLEINTVQEPGCFDDSCMDLGFGQRSCDLDNRPAKLEDVLGKVEVEERRLGFSSGFGREDIVRHARGPS